MKKVIFCEGKHDSVFLEKLFPKIKIPASAVKIFDQKMFVQKMRTKPKGLMSDAETDEFRKFFKDDNPNEIYKYYKILVKSETGKSNAVRLFTEHLPDYVNKVEPVLMLDLDSPDVKKKRNLKKALDDLDNKIMKGLNKDIIKIEWEEPKENNLIYLIKGNLKSKKTQRQIGNPFYVILFVPSLEAVAEKITPSGNGSIKDKISKLVELPYIQNTFSLLF